MALGSYQSEKKTQTQTQTQTQTKNQATIMATS